MVTSYCYKAYIESLGKWADGTLRSLRFSVPMIWRKPKNHFKECYFYLTDLEGFNRLKKKPSNYLNLESARQLVPHCEEVPVPEFNDLSDLFVE